MFETESVLNILTLASVEEIMSAYTKTTLRYELSRTPIIPIALYPDIATFNSMSAVDKGATVTPGVLNVSFTYSCVS